MLLFVFLVNFPANNADALEFFDMNFLNLERLILPLEDFTPLGASFNALERLDLDTPKRAARSLPLRLVEDPWAKAAWSLLATSGVVSLAVGVASEF